MKDSPTSSNRPAPIFLCFVFAALTAISNFGLAQPASIELTSPQPYQVIQRQAFQPDDAHANAAGGPRLGYADVAVRGKIVGTDTSKLEYRVLELNRRTTDSVIAVGWRPFTPKTIRDEYTGVVRVPAGGWYRLELRGHHDGEAVVKSIEPFGVGEVFLVAGQSYATNANDEQLRVEDDQGRITAYDWNSRTWRIAHDPQPVGEGSSTGGSIWPAFGDYLYPAVRVPIGLANVAVGGTSSTQWLPDAKLHPRLVEVGKTLGHFRAVLWQQGESDVIAKTSRSQYVANIRLIRRSASEAWGFDPVWLLAKSTLHPTVYNNPSGESEIRGAIAELCQAPGFRPGPDTDILGGENRGPIGSKRHFSAVGQRRAALLWFASVWHELNFFPVVPSP